MNAQPSLFAPSLPAVRKSRTSQAAARAVQPSKAEAQRRAILAALDKAGAAGLTDGEIQERSGVHPDAERPRRVELVNRGLVIKTARERPSPKNQPCTVWVGAQFGATP